MSSASGIRVQTLDHITLVVKDLARSKEFYVGLLGMEEVPRPDFAFAGSWFQAGETLIHLILEFEESGPAGNRVSEDLSISRTTHFAFLVDDALAAAEILKQHAVPIVSGPKSRPDGASQVFVQDPDGYVVELASLPS